MWQSLLVDNPFSKISLCFNFNKLLAVKSLWRIYTSCDKLKQSRWSLHDLCGNCHKALETPHALFQLETGFWTYKKKVGLSWHQLQPFHVGSIIQTLTNPHKPSLHFLLLRTAFCSHIQPTPFKEPFTCDRLFKWQVVHACSQIIFGV